MPLVFIIYMTLCLEVCSVRSLLLMIINTTMTHVAVCLVQAMRVGLEECVPLVEFEPVRNAVHVVLAPPVDHGTPHGARLGNVP